MLVQLAALCRRGLQLELTSSPCGVDEHPRQPVGAGKERRGRESHRPRTAMSGQISTFKHLAFDGNTAMGI